MSRPPLQDGVCDGCENATEIRVYCDEHEMYGFCDVCSAALKAGWDALTPEQQAQELRHAVV